MFGVHVLYCAVCTYLLYGRVRYGTVGAVQSAEYKGHEGSLFITGPITHAWNCSDEG